MTWTYNGQKNAFVNANVLGNLTVGGTTQTSSLVATGSARIDGQLTVKGNTFFQDRVGYENEKYDFTRLPDVQPGPVARVSPNIQFSPRGRNGCVPATTGDDQLLCTVLHTGMVTITGQFVCPQATRANGTTIADLGNTALEGRLRPNVNHRFPVGGQPANGAVPVELVLTPTGAFVLLNANTATAGNLTYTITGYWMVGAMTAPGIFYGNGGY